MDLSKIQNSNGVIKIAAMDHRDSLKKYIDEPLLPEFKNLLVKAFAQYSTAVLVDPKYGMDAIQSTHENNLGLMLSREKTGYVDNPDGRITELLEEFDSEKLKSLGADAVKIMLFYNADASNATQQIDVLKRVRDETVAANMPLLVEPIVYPIDGTEFNKGKSVIQSIKDMHEYCDVLKIQFPMEIDPKIPVSETNFEAAIPFLESIKTITDLPWVLLSKGMPFEHYKQALITCKNSGCSGFAVGRAVWQEALELKDWDRIVNFIETTGKERMAILSDIYND